MRFLRKFEQDTNNVEYSHCNIYSLEQSCRFHCFCYYSSQILQCSLLSLNFLCLSNQPSSLQPHLHMSSPALSALIFTLLCSLSDEEHFSLTNPCFSPDPGYFPPQPFLQTSYTLTLDIASLIHYIFQNHLHHSEVVDCFILSLIKYQQKWSCDLKDIRS